MRATVHRATAVSAVLLLAGCLATPEQDRLRYERILWENQPGIRSDADAVRNYEELSAKKSLTLGECYRLAIHRTETLALKGEELARLQTQYEQAVASYLPRLSFKGSFTEQEDVSTPGIPSSFTLPKRTEYKFNLKQPIFNGLREIYAIRQGDALYASKESDLRQARLLLYNDVAQAFYSVLRLQRELDTTRDSLRLSQERLDELTERQKVGMSRQSEVLAQEAEAASTQARVERLTGSLSVAWETLRFATGALPESLVDTMSTDIKLAPAETYLQKAVESRDDLRSLREQVRAAAEGIGVARAGWYPTLSLEANYYTHRAGISELIDWDFTISGELPLFDGFTTQAKVREAESNLRSSRLRLEAQLRSIQLEIRRAQAEATSLQNELASLDKALTSAEANYERVQAEYRQGIVTNLEVLTSFTTRQNARLNRDRTAYQLKLSKIDLDVRSGSLPGETK